MRHNLYHHLLWQCLKKKKKVQTNEYVMAGWRESEQILTHLFHYVWREDSRCEGTAEDVGKLLIQAADTHLLKVPVWADDRLTRISGLGFS